MVKHLWSYDLVTSAVILCGGLGLRMGDLTKTTPKALLRVKNKPIIWYTMKFLIGSGVKHFVFRWAFAVK